MQLYLSSYGLGHDTTALARWLCTHGREILLIPSARDRSPNSKAVQWDRKVWDSPCGFFLWSAGLATQKDFGATLVTAGPFLPEAEMYLCCEKPWN